MHSLIKSDLGTQNFRDVRADEGFIYGQRLNGPKENLPPRVHNDVANKSQSST